MDELVGRLVANVGVDRGTAEKAVGIILDFLRKEGPPDKVQALIDRLPGVEALLAQHSESGGAFPMGGIMGAGTKMMSAGLSMGQVQVSLAKLSPMPGKKSATMPWGKSSERSRA